MGNDDIYRTKLISRLTFSFTKHKLLIDKGRFNDLQMKVFYVVQSKTKRFAALHYAPTFEM